MTPERMLEGENNPSTVKNEPGSSEGTHGSNGNQSAPTPKKCKQTSITSFFPSSKNPKRRNQVTRWTLSNGDIVTLDDKVKSLPGIGRASFKKLLAEEIKTIRDLKRKQLKCKRESDTNSFVNYMKQFGFTQIYAEACEKELNMMPSWACREIKQENGSDSDSDSDVICIGDFTEESGLQRTFKLEDNTEVDESNENSNKRSSIWRGILEWKDLRTKDPSQTFKEIPCVVTSSSKDGAAVELDDWPPKLTMQLLPKTLISNVSAEYLKNSTSVLLHPTPCPALEALTKRMRNDFAGCVQFKNETISNCESKILIVLYSPEKKVYLGFIPNDQNAFMEQLFSLIQQQKNNFSMRKPKIKIKSEKFTEDIEIIDLDEIDDENSQNPNIAQEPANEHSSHSSSAVPETRENRDSIAQSADTNSNSISEPTTSVSDKKSIRVKPASELIPTAAVSFNKDVESVSASTSESSKPITEHNPANIHEKPSKPSDSQQNVEGGEFSRQLAKETDKIQNINSSTQESPMNLSTQSSPVDKTTKKRSLVQDNESNQESQRENLTVLDNAETQSNRESLLGHNSSMTCSSQGSGAPTSQVKKRRTIPAKSVTGIADKLLKKQLFTNSKNKNNISNGNENLNEVIPSTSSKDNCDKNLPGIDSSQSLEQASLPSTSSDLHPENLLWNNSSDSLELEQAMLSVTSLAFPGMNSTNRNNEGSNVNIDNAPAPVPAPQPVQEEVPMAPQQRQRRPAQRKKAPEKRRSLQKVKTLSNGVRVTPSSNPEKLSGVGPEGSAKLLAHRIKTVGALKNKQRIKGRTFGVWLEDDVKFTRADAEACEKDLKEIRWKL